MLVRRTLGRGGGGEEGGAEGGEEMGKEGGRRSEDILAYLRSTTMFGKRNIISQDIRKGLIPALALERRRAEQHLIHQYPQRPPVHCASMTASLDDFRRYVFFCANEGIGAEVRYTGFGVDGWNAAAHAGYGTVAEVHHCWGAAGTGLLGEIEIGKHYVAGLMEKYV